MISPPGLHAIKMEEHSEAAGGKFATLADMSTVESVSIISYEHEIRILETVKRFWGFDDL